MRRYFRPSPAVAGDRVSTGPQQPKMNAYLKEIADVLLVSSKPDFSYRPAHFRNDRYLSNGVTDRDGIQDGSDTGP